MDSREPLLNAADKMVIYQSAQELLNASFSHPQVVERLMEVFELNELEGAAAVVIEIVDKAVTDAWEKLEELVRTGFANGTPLFEIKQSLYPIESDHEIVDYISDSFYALRVAELEAASDERALKSEGSIGMLKYGAGAAILFFVSSNLYLKWLWAAIFIISVFIWLAGYISGRHAKRINQFFNHESDSESI